MTFLTSRPEKSPVKRGAKPKVRSTFTGAIRVDGERVVITPERGAYRRTIDDAGDVINDVFEAGAMFVRNIGDRLIVCGPSIEETALAVVLAVSRDCVTLYAKLLHGLIAATTTKVHLMAVAPSAIAKQLGLFDKRKRRRASKGHT